MKNEKRIRVAFYMRVSTVEQTEGFSLQMQEEALKQHVERNGYKGWYTNAKWHFSEQGSGGDTERKELKRMLKMAKEGEFDLVLVWKIDRISRSLTDLLEIFETLHKHGVGFASLKEDIDFTGAVGKLIFQIFGALAEFERENIKMRTTEGKKMSAYQGNYVGGSIPYGYEKIKNPTKRGSKLNLVGKEAQIVKQIFNWFVYEKMTVTEIARELNKMGVSKGKSLRSTAKGTKWADVTVRNILKNEIYRGAYITNRFEVVQHKPKRSIERLQKDWIINEVPFVVNQATFSAAQLRLKSGSKGKRGGGKEIYMLAGKLVDIATGKGFVGYKSAKGTKNYRRKKVAGAKGLLSKNVSIAAKDMEGFVWDYVEKAISRPEVFLKIHKENSDNFKKTSALIAKHTIYENNYSKANEKIQRVENDFYEGNIDQAKRGALLAQFTQERDHSFEIMRDVDKQIKTLSLYDSACRDVKKFSENMKEGIGQLTYEQKTDIVNMLVEKVEIHEDEEKRILKVYFRFDQKAVASVISSSRTDLVHRQAKNAEKATDSFIGGGR